MTLPPRVVITSVSPATPNRAPAKATVGLPLPVRAVVFAEGHDVVFARVRFGETETQLEDVGNDHFMGFVVPAEAGAQELWIDGWVDEHATWRHRITAKLDAGQDVTAELEEGARLLEADADRIPFDVSTAVKALREKGDAQPALALELPLLPSREQTTSSGPWPLWIERDRAAVGAWYELFPRSYGGLAAAAATQLDRIAAMGFDIVYLPPVHPIGVTARKGKDNTLTPGPDDPGSPWAIGSAAGGHEDLDAALGTLEDFATFVAETRKRGMEVALDYALQCSPDHPWVRDHPEWFTHRPDGSIRFAENPPKQYQDIYPINFFPASETDRQALWDACLHIMETWIERGVHIFRVDNPHTKPFSFWEWLIAELRARHPDVVLLAEAFTSPARMHRLGEVGFSQSYTYFTWRTTKHELTEYGEELVGDAASFRPNFWPNTPDILSGPLRWGRPSAFKIRAVLAATMSPSWGMYSGYELCENQPASDTNEEYAHSEKYELRARDWSDPTSIADWIATLNGIRHRHRAFADVTSLRFHSVSSDDVIAYSKQVGDDVVMTVVNLDPYATHDGELFIDVESLGLPGDRPLEAHDEISGQTFQWWWNGAYIRLDPDRPAHVVALRAPGQAAAP
jgi:starch synthase (maltosyl-transferring)